LRAATIVLLLRLTELNQPQTITAPSNPQPISKLASSLARLGLGGGGPGG
jgi:hypothetical protein